MQSFFGIYLTSAFRSKSWWASCSHWWLHHQVMDHERNEEMGDWNWCHFWYFWCWDWVDERKLMFEILLGMKVMVFETCFSKPLLLKLYECGECKTFGSIGQGWSSHLVPLKSSFWAATLRFMCECDYYVPTGV